MLYKGRMARPFDLSNAIITMPISMARIEGDQTARRTVDVLVRDDIKPHIPARDSTDIHMVTTAGLYMVTDTAALHGAEPYQHREKLLGQDAKFRRDLGRALQAARETFSRVRPDAFRVTPFDTCCSDAFDTLPALRGHLKQAFQAKPPLRDAVLGDINHMGREATGGNVAFLIEEHAMTYDWCRRDKPFASLVRDTAIIKPQRLIMYPGALMASQAAVIRTLSDKFGKIPDGQAFYQDTTKPFAPQDMATLCYH